MVHDLDPFLWQIHGDFGVRWYGLSYLAGFICGYALLLKMANTYRTLLPARLVADFVTYMAIGILVGGRIGYVIFYNPSLIMEFDTQFPYWGVVAVNKGGMASHGGFIGVVVACWLFSRRFKIKLLHLFDLVAICGPIGIFFGRIANFINGELVGRPAPENFPLGVKFPADIYSWPAEAPEKLAQLSSVVEKLGIGREKWLEWVSSMSFSSEARNFVNSTIFNIVNAIQNGQAEVKQALAPMLVLRHPSQLYAALGEGLVVFLCLATLWLKPRKSGFIGSAFLVIYAIARIAGEQFRMPDAHIGFEWLGLTRGQWLSSAMLLVGLVLMAIWHKYETVPIGGFGRKRAN